MNIHLFEEVTPFLDRLFSHLAEDSIDISSYILDHLCYRVETSDEYSELQGWFSQRGVLLGEVMIGGRPISTYRLDTPIVYHERLIDIVELPSPKPGSSYPTGWEHAEFAVGAGWLSLMETYPGIDWDTRATGKAINPDISIKYPDGTSVKFHEYTLDYVIEYLE